MAALLPDRLYLPLRYVYHSVTKSFDKEIVCAGTLAHPKRRFLDIGANAGIYSYYFLNRMEAVEAFEPLAECSTKLAAISNPSLKIHNVALSDKAGKLEFHVPIDGKGRLLTTQASLEPRIGNSVTRTVDVKRLDDFGFDDVDMIKIDVEGHEVSVIRGAAQTISACKPIMVIEIEQRHTQSMIQDIFSEIQALGYEGFFFDTDGLKSIRYFNVEIHQTQYLDDIKNPGYVNNFIFRPSSALQG